jgi:4-hydroxy-tetrahydrodipicolinate synthase
MCGLIQPVFRLPYVPLSKEQRIKGAALLEGVREHLPSGVKEIRVMEDSEFQLVKGY